MYIREKIRGLKCKIMIRDNFHQSDEKKTDQQILVINAIKIKTTFIYYNIIGNQTKSLCSFQHFTVVDWIYSRSYCSQFTRLALSNLTSRFLNVRDTTKPIKS